MEENPDCNTCMVWRKVGSTILCSKEDCKDCGRDANNNFAYCACRNCKRLKDEN